MLVLITPECHLGCGCGAGWEYDGWAVSCCQFGERRVGGDWLRGRGMVERGGDWWRGVGIG